MISPQQDIYNSVYDVCSKLGDVYEKAPPKGTPYPFIWLGQTELLPDRNKSVIFANVIQTIRFYAKDSQRGTISQLMFDVENALRELKETDQSYIDLVRSNTTVLGEVDGNDNLYHGILEVEFKVY